MGEGGSGEGGGPFLPVPLFCVSAESFVPGFESSATQILSDVGRSLAPLWASVSLSVQWANPCFLTSAHKLLGGFDGSLKGTWEWLGGWVWGFPVRVGLELRGGLSSLLRGVSISLYPTDEVEETPGEDAMSNQGREDLCPQGHHQPVGCPLPPPPPLGPPSGLSLQGGAIQTWERGAAGIILTPGWGPGWAGSGQLQEDSRPGHPDLGLRHTLVPLSTQGVGGKMRGGTEISLCIPSLQAAGVRCDGMSTRLGILRPESWLLVGVLLGALGRL